jgi:hypothetical protein
VSSKFIDARFAGKAAAAGRPAAPVLASIASTADWPMPSRLAMSAVEFPSLHNWSAARSAGVICIGLLDKKTKAKPSDRHWFDWLSNVRRADQLPGHTAPHQQVRLTPSFSQSRQVGISCPKV